MFPAIRIGYLVLPQALVEPFARAKLLADGGSAFLEQEALADFIGSGAFERHIRRSRAWNGERRTVLLRALTQYLGDDVTVAGTNAGLHVVAWLRGLSHRSGRELVAHPPRSASGSIPSRRTTRPRRRPSVFCSATARSRYDRSRPESRGSPRPFARPGADRFPVATVSVRSSSTISRRRERHAGVDEHRDRPHLGPKQYRNWGSWGAADELGTLNYITPEKIIAAATLVRQGKVLSLAIPFDSNGPQTGFGGRINPLHYMLQDGGDVASGAQDFIPGLRYCDDAVTMPLQCATQWDALSHIYFDGKMYNDRGPEMVNSNGARANSIDKLKDKIVSRGVLLDIPRYRRQGLARPGEAIYPADLDGAAAQEKVSRRDAATSS